MAVFHHWWLIVWVLAAWCVLSVALIPLIGFVSRRIK
jgi:hypothetical protein